MIVIGGSGGPRNYYDETEEERYFAEEVPTDQDRIEWARKGASPDPADFEDYDYYMDALDAFQAYILRNAAGRLDCDTFDNRLDDLRDELTDFYNKALENDPRKSKKG
jgi:hypothetical protein